MQMVNTDITPGPGGCHGYRRPKPHLYKLRTKRRQATARGGFGHSTRLARIVRCPRTSLPDPWLGLGSLTRSETRRFLPGRGRHPFAYRLQSHGPSGIHRSGAAIVSNQPPGAPTELRIGVLLHPLDRRHNVLFPGRWRPVNQVVQHEAPNPRSRCSKSPPSRGDRFTSPSPSPRTRRGHRRS